MRRPPKKLPWFAALAVAVIGLVVQGGGKAPKDKGTAKTEVSQQTAVAIPATNITKIKEAKGESISVSGRVAKANVSSSGTHFLNFDGSAFKVVCLADLAKRFPGGGPAVLYKGKSIVVSGEIELYKGDPQIKVTGPDQIQVIGGGSSIASSGSESGKAPAAGNFKLQKVGKTTWQSPAGLTYKGRDPKGLTRVEHIMRHAQDQPGRAGKHGVFDGNTEAEVFAVLDQAWNRAEQQGVRAKNEGGRSVLTVSMGRRVGYLGGRVGGQRRKPALSKVRIVFETGTKNIVTAFPN